jgi:GT2 family glycosyltransferase
MIATGDVGPAPKRDIGAQNAKGKYLAFIDDDAFPVPDWLKEALKYFKDKEISAVCGPGITPPNDDKFQKAGGYVNSLWFGSGGAGTYRFVPMGIRYVDDYPSMNIIIRKEDFNKVGGFDTHFWPGEDTKLCHELVYKLKKKIIYDPGVVVYHHRKPLFFPHLRQISRFAIHRGHFARILPATSFRLGYLIPTLFVLFLIKGLIISVFIPGFWPIYSGIILFYLFLLTANITYVTFKSKSIYIAVLTGMGIFLTHIVYGILFPVGFLKKSLKQ